MQYERRSTFNHEQDQKPQQENKNIARQTSAKRRLKEIKNQHLHRRLGWCGILQVQADGQTKQKEKKALTKT